MLIASVLEPALLAPELFNTNPSFRSRTIERFDELLRAHILLIDDQADGKSVMSDTIVKFLQSLPACIQQRLNAFPTERLVRMKIGPEASSLVTLPIGTKEAISVADQGKADVLFLTQQTADALTTQGNAPHNAYTYDSYAGSTPYERECATRGGLPLAEMSQERFVREILGPVVYWARNVTLIDKMLTVSSIGSQANRTRFANTIKLIHKTWSQGHFKGEGTFTLITFPDRDHREIPPRDQAITICQAFEVGHLRITIHVKDPAGLWDAAHDRYLTTSQGVVLGFTRGFDLTAGHGDVIPCDVYLRACPSAAADVVPRVMKAQNRAVVDWPIAGIEPQGFRPNAFDTL